MEVKICTREEYPAFLDMINDAFGYGAAKAWFQEYLTNCTPYPAEAADSDIKNHFICMVNGNMAGGLGCYPLDWRVSDNRGNCTIISAYGIGQVACHKDYRGQGVMTALLEAAEKEMQQQGRGLGFLTGDRYRYAHFGYNFGGTTLRYSLESRRYKRDIGALTVRQAVTADIAAMEQAYSQMPSCVLRSVRMWERQLKRKNLCWLIGELHGKKGYLAHYGRNEDPSCNVLEVFGDTETVAAMLRDLMEKHKIDRVTVQYPMQNGVPDAMSTFLYSVASWVEALPLGLFALTDAAALGDALSTLEGARDFSGLEEETQRHLLSRLCGFAQPPLSEGMKDLISVSPLTLWISEADHI